MMGEDRPTMSNQQVLEETKKLLREKPSYREVLTTIINAMEQQHDTYNNEAPTKVNVRNLRVNPGNLAYLKRKRLMYKPVNTNTYKVWEFTNKEMVDQALQQVSPPQEQERMKETQPVGKVDLSELDKLIEVRDVDARIKKVMRKAVTKPGIHIAFVGPPGTGKSLIAGVIENLPRSLRVPGTDVTRASLRDDLVDKRPRFLVFDEMDKVQGTNAMDAVQLLSRVMEEQVLSVQVTGKETTVNLPLNLFAFGNTYNFPSNIKDRFLPLYMREYTEDEFRELILTAFPKYEGINKELAEAVLEESLRRGMKSYRKCRSIAKICDDPSDVEWVFETFEFDKEKLERL